MDPIQTNTKMQKMRLTHMVVKDAKMALLLILEVWAKEKVEVLTPL